MRTTHERERSEFRRSRCESAQKNAANRKGGVVSLFSWTFRRREPKARAKPLFFLFFLWRIWELLEDIFSTLLLSQEDKIFMRRFLRSPHLGSSSTGVYLYYSTHIYQQKENEREHTNTHARMHVPSRRASFDTTTTTTRRRRRSYRPLSLADKRKQDTSQSEVPVRPPNASKYSPD